VPNSRTRPIKRLVASLTRLLDPAIALRTSSGASAAAFTSSRPVGGTLVLDALWRRLGIDTVMIRPLEGRKRDPRTERVLLALVANRALARIRRRPLRRLGLVGVRRGRKIRTTTADAAAARHASTGIVTGSGAHVAMLVVNAENVVEHATVQARAVLRDVGANHRTMTGPLPNELPGGCLGVASWAPEPSNQPQPVTESARPASAQVTSSVASGVGTGLRRLPDVATTAPRHHRHTGQKTRAINWRRLRTTSTSWGGNGPSAVDRASAVMHSRHSR